MQVNALATRGDHHLEYHALAQITAIERHASGWQVVGQAAGKPFCYRVDRIIANIGYQPAWELAEQVGICGCLPPAHAGHPPPPAHATHAAYRPHPPHPPPGYFLLGARGHGRRSDFLLALGLEQVGQLVATLADWRNR
jgi:predicted TIM-barrel fold metal-dependent hydrolase